MQSYLWAKPIYCAADELLYKFYQKKLIEFVNEANLWNRVYSAFIVGKNMAEDMKCGEAEAHQMFLLFFVAAHGYASLLANNTM